MKYLCAVLLVLCTSASAWATDATIADGRYELVTDLSTLSSGDKIIIAGQKGGHLWAMQPYSSGNNCSCYDNGSFNTTSPTTTLDFEGTENVAEFTISGSASGWSLYDGANYYYTDGASSSNNNYLKGSSNASVANHLWTISKPTSGSSTGQVIIQNTTNTYVPYMHLSTNSTPKMACYSSSSSSMYIYKNVPAVTLYYGANGAEKTTIAIGANFPDEGELENLDVSGWGFQGEWATSADRDCEPNYPSGTTYASGSASTAGTYYAVYYGTAYGCNFTSDWEYSCKPTPIYQYTGNNPSSGSGVNLVVPDVGCGPEGTTVTLTLIINEAGTSYQGATIVRDDNGAAVPFVYDDSGEDPTITFSFPSSDVTATVSFECPDLKDKDLVTINTITPVYNTSTHQWNAPVTWNAVSGATRYGYGVNVVETNAMFVTQTPTTETGVTINNITEGTEYSIHVIANNPCTSGNTTAEASKHFTAECPTLEGTLVIAVDEVTSTGASISWSGATTSAVQTTGGASTAITYDVKITQSGGADGGILNVTDVDYTEWSSTSLTTGATYTVQVTAKNVCGETQVASQTFKCKAYTDYQFTCADLAWSTPDGTDPIWVTSTSGQVVRSQKKLHLTGSGLKPGAISFTINGVAANELTETSVFAIRNKDYTAVTANGSGEIDQDVYVFYKPTVTSDGLDLNAVGTEIIATSGSGKVESREYRAMSATLANVAINGRHLPSTFVIAAKWGKAWYALPANMTETATEGSNPTPVLIAVDDADAPTMAYCDNTNAYNLVPIGGTGTDRFKADGDKVYLGMVNNSNYALFASGHSSSGSENTNIGKSSGQTTTVSGLGVNYQWNLVQTATSVSSTADVVYNLAIASGNTNSPLKISRGEGKWGMYSAGISAIRLLPFTEIGDLVLTIEEWGTSEIAVKYTGSGTITKVMVDEHEVASPVLSTIGGDIQRISGLTLDESKNLTNYPMSQFVIQMTENSVLKQKIVHIPFIVTTSDATTIALREMTGEGSQTAMNEVIKTIDVVVRDGGTLTVNTAEGKATPCTFNNLYIYPGGKVDVSGNTLNVQNVYLRGGFSWLGSPEFGLPRMRVASDKSITGIGTAGHGVYYDLYLNSDIYYMTALPKDVALSDIRNEEGTTDFKAWIKYYNGGNRAGVNTDKPWVSVTSGSLKRGVGYEIAIKKRNGRPYGILRFPLLKATTWSNETECNPDVTAWGMTAGEPNEGVTANNAGWNLVGNPFMTAFHNSADDNIVNYGFTKHGNPWDGTYDWDKSGDEEKIKYFTIPEYTYEDWRDVRSIGATLEAFYPFAVQVKLDGKLAFAPANRDLKPSILRQKMAEREVMVDFELKDANGTTDVAGLTICNDYSAAFDSEDKEKTIKSNSYLKVYTMVGEYRTAFNSLPEADAAQPIPVGYIAPVAGSYTFALLEDGDYSTLEHLWLTDYETSKTVDLLTENYTFETAAGETNTRFALNAILKAEGVTTEIGDIEGADVMNMSVYGGNKHLVVRGLPSGADVWVYDAAGKLVATWTNVSDASVQTDVPASGVYSVRAIHNNTAVTKRAIVK